MVMKMEGRESPDLDIFSQRSKIISKVHPLKA
jgi:hypothetical protein